MEDLKIKIYNQDKTQVLEEVDRSLGWLKNDTIIHDNDGTQEVENIYVYMPYSEKTLNAMKLSNLRQKRRSLLSAFDRWEKAVLRGRETDDTAVMAWYQSLLDLDELAFDSIPERVAYYL